ncbi:MAG: SO_0444 family Cu/Zn efflux transporter [Candidatus Hydrogenedentota bacterium]
MNLLYSIQTIALETWGVAVQMAPYLLFGFLVAGVLSVLVSAVWIERHLGGHGVMPIIKSVLFGVPLPLCSCGVIAVAASIRQHGASRGATTGFLLATPQTGVDSILATWGMLGPVFGIFRPAIALITGVVGGLVVSAGERKVGGPGEAFVPAVPAPEAHCSAECCDTEQGGESRIVRILRYGLITLPRDIAKPLVLGIILAGLITALIPEDALASYIGGGPLAMLVMIVVGIPLYVCSTASIPLAVGFMHMGASPGAALAFLIAGPATNAATFTTVWKLLGRRTALIYVGTVFVAGLVFGLVLDGLFGALDTSAYAQMAHAHGEEAGLISIISAFVLVAVILVSLVPAHWRVPFNLRGTKEKHTMPDSLTLKVTGMNCSHCSGAVERGLREAPGVTGAEVDLDSGRARVAGEGLNPDHLVQIVRDLGYRAEPQSDAS